MTTGRSTTSDPHPPAKGHPSEILSDFSTGPRVLLLCLFAVPIGIIGALVSKGLLWLIAVITNGAFFLRFSSLPVTPAANHLGLWVVAVPVLGSVAIGLMARFGSARSVRSCSRA